ncbi:sodium/potassium-transporting ATPase subunit beta-1-interacting protein isoform X2 [Bacillus rossius redtenbacheri]|uniref:sodium/potassium-transporting ATPase subunit beta-1-interacting protein isoform X2 n=1 Tax=Bacillus rossius redtenbacheri TaxID=93214 RepID=UPI002FDCFB80
MEIYKRRYFLLSICVLQLILTLERQVFDFLGYMWAPILANFFNIIFVIFGFFGGFQYKQKYIIMYMVWCVIWVAWNIFIICFYLRVGIFDKDSDVLNLGTGSASWWEVNGAGCRPVYSTNLTLTEPYPFRPIRPEQVTGCVLEYQYIETLHAAVQCFFAVLGGIGGATLCCVFNVENEPCRTPGGRPLSPRPMTPRRVKRRSVISRGSTSRSSQHEKHGSVRYNNTLHGSNRASYRRPKILHQNPVTRIIEQQQHNLDSSNTFSELNQLPFPVSSQSSLVPSSSPHWKKPLSHTNPLHQQNCTHSLSNDDIYNNRPSSARSSYSNYHGTRPISCFVEPGGASAYYIGSQATPQVFVANTHRRSSHRTPSTTAFLNSGPPPYDSSANFNSETAI